MNLIKFVKSTIKEAKKIEWLNKKELILYSIIVISFIIVATILTGLLDIVLIETRTFLFNKL